jgi:hypothetical protein
MGVGLFGPGHLDKALSTTLEKARQRLVDWNPDALLKASEPDVIETLINEASVRCPRLLRDQVEMLEPAEAVRPFMQFGERYEQRVAVLTLVVPYEGERPVFLVRASTRQMVAIEVAQLTDTELHLTVEGAITDGAQVRRRFEEQLDRIAQHLDWARTDIERHNDMVRGTIPRLVRERRAELRSVRDVQSEIGYPMRRRPDAGSYSVPVKRTTIRPVPKPGRTGSAASAPFAPEPALTEDQYEQALQVLRAQRNALERTPSLAAGMDEETIRDLLLVGLNAQFEGTAAGEVFNGAGKTDILIRERDRSVFIGECKIWKGPKTISEALDQLLGYLVWRDIKAALLIFIRSKDVTAAVKAAVAKIEEHANYKRRGTHDTDERVDFVMHAQGDRDREIHLAFLPFALPGDASGRFSSQN